MRFSVIRFSAFLCLFLIAGLSAIRPAYSQQANILDQNLSQVKSDELSDAQVRQIVQQVKASGKSIEGLDQLMLDRGMAPEEVSKLKVRVERLTAADMNLEEARPEEQFARDRDNADTASKRREALVMPDGLPLFGTAFFSSPGSTFTPDINRPTPANYVIGPGDELTINVFGQSVVNWSLTVRPEGHILLPGMGNVYVGGKTIENATTLIREVLRAHNYAIGRGTEATVSLTNIRSIKVAITGEVRQPGTYTLSSLSTVFNALYLSGGPNRNGSLRAIEVFRDNALLARVDFYQFLLQGDNSGDLFLRDGDIIRVPEYRVRVSIEGEVKRPAHYEVMPGESLKDLLLFAGGFTNEAYRANIKVIQLTDKQRRVKDIPQTELESYIPNRGDRFRVETLLDRFENRVTINGAVFRPGDFELEPGMSLRDLIRRAEGLKEDAFPTRGYITRLNPDNTTRIIAFNLEEVRSGKAADLPLQREDVVNILSIFDVRESYAVSIRGMVREPGNFPYSENMTVEDLILQAGGLADGANPKRVVIARRVKDSDRRAKDAKLAEVIELDVDKDLTFSGPQHVLQPYDVVSVFALPGYETPRFVQIEGEVMFPGTYSIIHKDERISDLIERAGGFTAYAFLDGASLKRAGGYETAGEREQEQLKVAQFKKGQEEITGDSTEINLQDIAVRNDYVGIDLKRILKHPGKRFDLILQDGDVLTVPGQKQTVSVSGAVLSPNSVVYSQPGFLEYIHRSGGFTSNAMRRKSYVVYANGSVAGTKSFLFFRSYPIIAPGAEIFVPEKPQRDPLSVQGWLGIGTSMASLAAIVFAIVNSSK